MLAIGIVVVLLVAVGIGALNDKTKKWAVKKARREKRPVKPEWLENQTNWNEVSAFLLAAVLFIGGMAVVSGFQPSRFETRMIVYAAVGIVAVVGFFWRRWRGR